MNAPVFYRNADGTVRAEWPDPLARDYPVSVEMLRQWVTTHNDMIQARNLATALAEVVRRECADPEDIDALTAFDVCAALWRANASAD